MADFATISEMTTWPRMPAPLSIADHTSPIVYQQDAMGSDAVNRQQVDVTDNLAQSNRYAAPVASSSQLFQDSLMWPRTALLDKCALPFLVSGGVTVFVVPVFEPTAGIGAALVFGYAAGVIGYYLQFYNKNQTVVTPVALVPAKQKYADPNPGFIL